MIIDKNELKDILGVSLEGIKTIEKRKQLGIRLDKMGYKLNYKKKQGRKTIYNIVQIDSNKEILYKLCTLVYNTNKPTEFSKYLKTRTNSCKENKPVTLDHIAKEIQVNNKTIHRWDLQLLDRDILSKDGYHYLSIDYNTDILKEVTQDEYNSYWRNKAYLSALKDLQDKYISGTITLTELQLASMDIGGIIASIDKRYVFKIKKYKLQEDNQLYKDTMELIKGGS